MSEDMRTVPGGVNTAPLVPPASQAGEPNDLQPVALVLEMQSSAALLTVLMTVARLGCCTTHIYATERQAALGVRAPRRVAHRLLPCLQELIEVFSVLEVPAASLRHLLPCWRN
jgi:hypothetical protein